MKICFYRRPVYVFGIVAAGVSVGLVAGSQPPKQGSRHEFEVASIKVAEARLAQGWPVQSGARLSWLAYCDQLILYAYNLQRWQVTGLPPRDIVFQIDAITTVGATSDDVRLMLQSLLVKRLALAVHEETKQVNGYRLTVGKGGFKLNEAKPGDPPAPLPPWFASQSVMIPQIDGKIVTSTLRKGVAAITGRGVTLAELAYTLQQSLRTFVLDRTNMGGKYYFGFSFVDIDAAPDADGPDISEAVQSLGFGV